MFRPMFIVVSIDKCETNMIEQYKSIMNEYPLIEYQLFETNKTVYPYNKMRNIAIKNIKTTHFYVCDMDFWPSCIIYIFPIMVLVGLYNRILELPDYILDDEWLAIIVPGFQYINNIVNCSPFQECVEKFVITYAYISYRVLPNIPSTKVELKKCILEKKCHIFSHLTPFHVYHT